MQWVVGLNMEENSIVARQSHKTCCVVRKEYKENIDCMLKCTMIGIDYSLIHIWKVGKLWKIAVVYSIIQVIYVA